MLTWSLARLHLRAHVRLLQTTAYSAAQELCHILEPTILQFRSAAVASLIVQPLGMYQICLDGLLNWVQISVLINSNR
jgi:hypothetical protein